MNSVCKPIQRCSTSSRPCYLFTTECMSELTISQQASQIMGCFSPKNSCHQVPAISGAVGPDTCALHAGPAATASMREAGLHVSKRAPCHAYLHAAMHHSPTAGMVIVQRTRHKLVRLSCAMHAGRLLMLQHAQRSNQGAMIALCSVHGGHADAAVCTCVQTSLSVLLGLIEALSPQVQQQHAPRCV